MSNHMHSALVTGASGGIGIEICKLLVERGVSVLAVARDPSRLEQATGAIGGAIGGVSALPCDLTVDGDVAQLMARCPRVDILVNCAGAMIAARQSDRSWEELDREIVLNAVVVARLCHHYGTAMIAAGQGRILNFASTAAARSAPLVAPYAASKAFVLHLSQSLAAEWRSSGVRVTCCVPGPVATSFATRGGLARRRAGSDPARVARAALAASDRGRVLCFPDVGARLRYAAFKFAPTQVTAYLAGTSYRQATR
jgi:short-subunit dehydrogenase